jgi:hypothetical protein
MIRSAQRRGRILSFPISDPPGKQSTANLLHDFVLS